MSYQFPLQRILDYKEKEKQQAQQEFGLSLQKKEDVEQEILRLVQKKEQVESQLYQPDRGYKAMELVECQRYIDRINDQVSSLQRHLRRAQKDVEKKQQLLMEKSKDEKIWNEWKTRLIEQDRQSRHKQEQDMLDELASIRYFRQQGFR
jgi:flagellar protein FliJ